MTIVDALGRRWSVFPEGKGWRGRLRDTDGPMVDKEGHHRIIKTYRRPTREEVIGAIDGLAEGKVMATGPKGRIEETAEELSARIERAGRRKRQNMNASQMQFMRTCTWDIESTNLNFDFGIVLCSSIKPIGEKKVITHRIDDDPDYEKHRWDDSKLVEAIRDELENYQVIVGWNHIKFDLPGLETRLVKHGLRALDKSNMCFVDGLWAARYRMRLHSNRLDSLIDFLGTGTHKTGLIAEWWLRAMAGDTTALEKIVDHNIKDVKATEEVMSYLGRFVKLNYRLVQ